MERAKRYGEASDLAALVGSLHDLLYENSALAGMVLNALTGPIRIVQSEPLPGKRRLRWTAEFTLNHALVFVEIARQLNCPTKDTWEFLSNRSWTIGTSSSVEVRKFKNAEKLGKTVSEMLSNGTTINATAIALGVDRETIESALAVWEGGSRCNLPPDD